MFKKDDNLKNRSISGKTVLTSTKKKKVIVRWPTQFNLKVLLSSIFVLILVTLSFSVGKSLFQTLDNQKRIETERAERDLLENEVLGLKLELQYLNSEEYVEQVGRNKLGLSKTGEKIVIFPEDKIERIELEVSDQGQKSVVLNKPNWQKWFEFLL